MTGAPVPLVWKGPLKDWPLVKHSVPGDGHCLIHAICSAFFEPYYTGRMSNGRQVSPVQIVKRLREQIAEYLRTTYDTLGRGLYSGFAKEVPEYSLENMIRTLKSSASLGYGYLELISDAINKDVYILDENTQDVYIQDSPELFYKGRRSVVLLYESTSGTIGHFSMLGLSSGSDVITHFEPSNPFITVLRSRVFINTSS